MDEYPAKMIMQPSLLMRRGCQVDGRLFRFCSRVALVMLATFLSSPFNVCAAQREEQFVIPLLAAPELPVRDLHYPYGVDAVRSNKEPTTFLLLQPQHNELLVGANRAGFGVPISLSIDAGSMNIADGADGLLWIGGFKRAAVTVVSTPLSTGYLVKFDRSGRILWEREYGDMETQRSIQSITSLPSGDIVVSGQDSARTWVARISGKDGGIVWERFVGNGKGSALTTLDGMIALVAIDSCRCDGDYRDDVAFWSFTDMGEPLDHQIVREELNRSSSQHAARLGIVTGNNSVYVFSAWTAFEPQPFEVALLNSKGNVIWKKSFPETVWHRGPASGSGFLPTGVLSSGDLLLISRDERLPEKDFFLRQFDAASGDLSEAIVRMPSAPPPGCYERWSGIFLMKEESEEKVLLIALPRSEAKRCGWIGEVVVPKPTK